MPGLTISQLGKRHGEKNLRYWVGDNVRAFTTKVVREKPMCDKDR